MNEINIELEIKRVANLFAEKQNMKINMSFNRPEGEDYNDEWFRHSGFHDGTSTPGLHKIYIRPERNSRALKFRTLSHELAHVLQQEIEGKQYSRKHDKLFWQTMDEITLPFVKDNLQSEEDKTALSNLLDPATNEDESWDWAYFESKEGKIQLSVRKENINWAWKAIRQEIIKARLRKSAYVSTSKISQGKHWINIYTHNNWDKERIAWIVERLMQLGFNETEIKVE